jgi:hypothetical protein
MTIRYPLLTKSTVTKFLPLIDRFGVSLVARGLKPSTQTTEGFLQAFYGGRLQELATKNQTWMQRRDDFIQRHASTGINLYKKNGLPTRRHLALIAWAYSPDPEGLKRLARRLQLKNRNVLEYLG